MELIGGRFVIHSDDEPMTPKGATISGDIGHILYLNPSLTVDGILERLKETKWLQNKALVQGVLEDYIKGNHVSRDDETGQYDMTDLGIVSFLSGWW